MQAPDPGTAQSHRAARRSALIILGLAIVLEVAFLYVLIAFDTPVAPWVRRAVRNPFGLFAVVMLAFTLVSVVITGLLRWLERTHAASGTGAGPTKE